MPGVDSHVFSFALNVFLFFGAASLTIELMIPLVVQCKRLKATMQSQYSMESGKLEARDSLHRDEFSKMSASLLTQVMALSPADRQIIRSLLDVSPGNGSFTGAQKNSFSENSSSGHDEDLGWLRISGGKSKSSLTH
jgi:hypothetical protein